MSEATYTFASSIRRGFTAGVDGRAEVTVRVPGSTRGEFTQGVELMSPGDAVGIGPGQVIRTWPRDGVHNAEPNYLALVELDAPELPWLFARHDGTRLHPWLMLVVIDETDLGDDPLSVPVDGGPTTVELPADQVPDPAEAWLWAHGQLLGTDTVPDDPSRSLSRLVCARRLRPDRSYLACVVPTFEAGRAAGVAGEALPAGDPLRQETTPRWTGRMLPVYHWWRFRTGAAGDFESLVRRLRGVALPDGLGTRRLRLDHPLSNLPPSGVSDLELHVALRPPLAQSVDIELRPDYVAALRGRLADADYDVSLLEKETPRIGPPVHGQLAVGPAARTENLGTGVTPPWLDELNLDPRHRVAAGLGAEVVRRNQEHYVEEAWRQVGDVLTANRLRRRAEFSLATSRRLYDRWIAQLDPGDLLTSTAPVHAKVGVGPDETIVGRLRDSPVPPAVVSVELRRLTRSRGELSQGSGWQASAGVSAMAAVSGRADALVQRVPLDSVNVLEPPSQVWGAVGAKEILGRLEAEGPGDLEPEVAAARLDAVSVLETFTLPPADVIRERLTAAQPDMDRVLSSIGLVPVTAVTDAVPEPATSRGTLGEELRLPLELAGSSLTPVLRGADVIGALRDQPGLVTDVGGRFEMDTGALDAASRIGRLATTVDRTVLDRVINGTYRPDEPPSLDFEIPAPAADGIRTELGDAVAGLAGLVIRPDDGVERPTRVLGGGLASLAGPLLAALDPQVTIRRAVNSRISALREGEDAVLDDILAAPDLSEPTYLQLAAISHDWLLPGLDELPPDTTTLVEANLEFIAAFLVGMNHELARELLWREYPTDQRGTYARQFWTHLAGRDPDARFDLKQELHRAAASTLRGLTRPPGGVVPTDPLVLVVKGDLVHRYPGLIITAAKTQLSGGLRVPRGTPLEPDFMGLLAPDVLLAGFTTLDTEEVLELEAGGDPDERWWFFFAEHFGEPRFGLDETGPPSPTTWNAASWEHVTDTETFLGVDTFGGTTLPKAVGMPGGLAWGTEAAAQAWITLQLPFRRGIPAAQLLPPEVPS